jgi:primase-like protein
VIAQFSGDQQASVGSEAEENKSGNSITRDAREPSQCANDTWFIQNIKMVSAAGYRVTPVYENGVAKPYADGQTYDNPDDPCWRQAVRIGVVLDEALLLDYDGNKASDTSPIISLGDLASELGLPELPEPVQRNEEGDSLHFLFSWPEELNEGEYKQANNGGWLRHIDLKRGNQLVNLKPHKLLPAGGLPAKDQLPEAPQKLLQALHRGPVYPKDTKREQARWDGSRGEVEEAHEILKHIPIEDEYDPWLDVLMRIHHRFGDTAEGIEIADEWSKQSQYYDREEIVRKFASFSSADDGRPKKSWGALCKRAKDNGASLHALAKMFNADESGTALTKIEAAAFPQTASTIDLVGIETASQLVERYVFVTSENKYFDLVTRDLHDPTVLNRIHAENFPRVKGKPGAASSIDTHPSKRMVHHVGWLPNPSPIFQLDGKDLANTYCHVMIDPAEGPVDDWLQLVRHVCGEYADLLLDHLAYTFQYPGKKIRWQILIFSAVRRTGKSLIFRIIKQLLGKSCNVVIADDLNAGWGDYFHQCKVLVIEELFEREGSKLIEKLKSRLANDDVEALNLKGGAICYQQNLMSMYMTTNHPDALRFDETEDKLLVIEGPGGKIYPDDPQASKDFYDRIGEWSDNPCGQAAALHYLLNRDISGFTPNQLPIRTQALKDMCAASAPDYQRRIAEMIADAESPFDKDYAKLSDIRFQLKFEAYNRLGDKGICIALRKVGWIEKQAQKKIDNKKQSKRYWVRADSAAAAMKPSEFYDHTHSSSKHGTID